MNKRAMGLLLIVTLSFTACTSTHYLAPAEKREFLNQRTIYLILDDGTELRLSRCVLQEDLLIGLTRNNLPVEVEMSRIRAAYFKKLKPGVPWLGAFSAGAAAITIWLLVGTATAPSEEP